MLRELLQENLDGLLLTIEKIGYAFDLLSNKNVGQEDLLELKRLVHSLKGNLLSLGLKDDAHYAVVLEELIFSLLEQKEEEIYISKERINVWFTYLNKIEFSLKAYLF